MNKTELAIRQNHVMNNYFDTFKQVELLKSEPKRCYVDRKSTGQSERDNPGFNLEIRIINIFKP